MIRAVIFDMDGVLVDSEMLYLKMFHEFMNANGMHCEMEDLYATVGSSKQKTIEIIERFSQPIMSGEEVFNRVLHIEEKIDYASVLVDGVKETLEYLKTHGYKIGLASSSPKDNILEVIHACEIASYFDVISSGYDFKESKPNPEIYLATMEKLGVKAHECIVLEDSYYGILAAKNAGIYTVARKDHFFNIDQSKADVSIVNVEELIQIVEHMEEES